MKKLMTALLCALGFSLVTQAEKISGTNFEGLDVDFEVIGKADDGSIGGGYWSNTVESVEALVATNTFTMVEVPPQEEGGDPTYEPKPDIAPYTGDKGYPAVHGENKSEKYLSINTKGGELVRNIQEGGTAQSIDGGIYFDSMVQFTATDALDANAGSESDKLILWLRDNRDGTTNLVVNAGYLNDQYEVESKDYVVLNSVQADKWYRLTIQAIAGAVGVTGKPFVGYAIYIDGEKACYETSEAAFAGGSDYKVSSPYDGYLYNENVHALYPSLKGWAETGVNTFTAVAFSGVGAVDDIMFTTNAYDVAFTKPPASLTVNWTVGIASITINNETFETSGSGSTNLVGGTYTVSAEATTGYCVTYSLPSTTNIDATESEVTLKIDTVEALAEINGVMYATLADAIAAVGANGTVKLYRNNDLNDLEENTLTIDTENPFVLDLNGKVLSGGNVDGDSVLSVESALTIIDSIGGGAVSNTTDEAVAVLVDGGSLVIGLDKNDMGATFFGSVGAANDVEPLSIVRGNFYGFGEISPAGYVADGSVGNMFEGCYVVAPDTNTYVAQIGNVKYETIQDAIDAAEVGDKVEVLMNVALDSNHRINVGADKNVTIDLGGFTLTASGDAICNRGSIVITNGTITASGNVAYNRGNSASMTIEDGIYTSTGDIAFAVYGATNSTITVNGGTITAQEFCVGNYNPAKATTITINGGTLTSLDNAVVGTNGTAGQGDNAITINGGSLNSGIITVGYVACGIYLPNNDTLVMNGGTINVTGGCGILARAGNVTVTGGEINTTGNAVGKVGDSRVVVPCSAVVFDTSANYPGYDVATAEATISGGTFTSEVDAIAWVKDNGDVNAIAVSGGAFSSAVADEFCANGFIPVTEPNAQGKYEVEAGWKITFVNDDDTLIYATNVQANATVEYLGETPTKAADAEYTYTFKGWTPALAVATADATYKATYDATPVATPTPTVDGKDVDADKVFDNATSASVIVYPTEPTTAKNQDGTTTITFNNKSSTVPAYYDVTIKQTQEATTYTVELKLNDTALPEIDEAVIAEEKKPAMEVTDDTTTVTLKATNAKLYYGLATADAPNANFTPPAPTTLTKGNGSAMQIMIPVDSTETSKFYKVYVTDIAPPQSGN